MSAAVVNSQIMTNFFTELRIVERKLIGIISEVIRETSFADTLDIIEDEASHLQRMAATVTKIWASIFQGAHLLEIDRVIGNALQILADTTSNPD